MIEDVGHADIVNPMLREKGIRSLLGVPLAVADKLLGVVHVGSLTPRTFGDRDIAMLEARGAPDRDPGRAGGAGRNGARRASPAGGGARVNSAFLAEASAVLGSSLDYETTLASVARLAVPALADWCVIDVMDDQARCGGVASVCANPASTRWRRSSSTATRAPGAHGGTSKVLRTGRSELVAEITPEWLEAIAPDHRQSEILRSLGLRSNILVPLIARGRTLGVLTLATARVAPGGTRGNLRMAEELAARAALAVDNARLFREAEESLRAARCTLRDRAGRAGVLRPPTAVPEDQRDARDPERGSGR